MIRAALARSRHALGRTLRIAVERPRTALWTLLTLTCALFAVGLAAVVADGIDRWSQRPDEQANMVVYLGEDVDAARAEHLVRELAQLPGVDHAELVPPGESARRLRRALGADPSLLDGVEPDSLPASVEVSLARGVRDVVAISPTIRALRGADGVDDVIVDRDDDDQLAAAMGAVRVVSWAAAALLAALAFVIVIAAVRVRLDRARDELAVAQLLGAGPAFMVVPTALAGALQGALAAVLAAAATLATLQLCGADLVASLAPSLGPIALAMPAVADVVVFVATGAALGFLGGALAGAGRATR